MSEEIENACNAFARLDLRITLVVIVLIQIIHHESIVGQIGDVEQDNNQVIGVASSARLSLNAAHRSERRVRAAAASSGLFQQTPLQVYAVRAAELADCHLTRADHVTGRRQPNMVVAADAVVMMMMIVVGYDCVVDGVIARFRRRC